MGLLDLPKDVFNLISQNLSLKDLAHLSQVSTKFNILIKNASFWNSYFHCNKITPSDQANILNDFFVRYQKVARYTKEVSFFKKHAQEIKLLMNEALSRRFTDLLDLSYGLLTQGPASLSEINEILNEINDAIFEAQSNQARNLTLQYLTRLNTSMIEIYCEQHPQDAFHPQLKRLDLKACCLIALPDNIGRLCYLESIDLSNNPITQLPESFKNITTLKFFYASHSNFPHLMDTLAQFKELESIKLEQVGTTHIPPSIRNLKHLRSLVLLESCAIKAPACLADLPLRDLTLQYPDKTDDVEALTTLFEKFKLEVADEQPEPPKSHSLLNTPLKELPIIRLPK